MMVDCAAPLGAGGMGRHAVAGRLEHRSCPPPLPLPLLVPLLLPLLPPLLLPHAVRPPTPASAKSPTEPSPAASKPSPCESFMHIPPRRPRVQRRRSTIDGAARHVQDPTGPWSRAIVARLERRASRA